MCIRCILSCIGTWITVKYGLRKATVPAGFLLGGSFFATSYAKSLDQLFATFSVPFGLAGCVLVMACNISLFTYFNKRLPIAFGTTRIGDGFTSQHLQPTSYFHIHQQWRRKNSLWLYTELLFHWQAHLLSMLSTRGWSYSPAWIVYQDSLTSYRLHLDSWILLWEFTSFSTNNIAIFNWQMHPCWRHLNYICGICSSNYAWSTDCGYDRGQNK